MQRLIKHTFLTCSILLGLLFYAPDMQARQGVDRVVWRQKPSSHTGLYTTQNYFVTHGVSLSFAGMYYYGDADNMGVAFNGGFNPKNLSLSGGLTFAYNMPLGNHCNLRAAIMAGTLQGNNKEKFEKIDRVDFRKFHSWVVSPSVGVEYYPFTKAGFFLYGGLSVTASIIDEYEYWHTIREGKDKVLKPVSGGNIFGILPMIQLGLGYSWRLSDSWNLSVELMVQEGLIDTQFMNLDGIPMDPSQNSYGVAIGSSFGTWIETLPDGREIKHIHWNDGWFQVGITISYRWSNCEFCRNSAYYGKIRGRR